MGMLPEWCLPHQGTAAIVSLANRNLRDSLFMEISTSDDKRGIGAYGEEVPIHGVYCSPSTIPFQQSNGHRGPRLVEDRTSNPGPSVALPQTSENGFAYGLFLLTLR